MYKPRTARTHSLARAAILRVGRGRDQAKAQAPSFHCCQLASLWGPHCTDRIWEPYSLRVHVLELTFHYDTPPFQQKCLIKHQLSPSLNDLQEGLPGHGHLLLAETWVLFLTRG